jgi:hypothetical protein
MSNLYKQVDGEWVEMSEREAEKLTSTRQDTVLQTLRLRISKLSSR